MLNLKQNRIGLILFIISFSSILLPFAASAIRAEVDWPELPGGLKIEDGTGAPGNLTATLPELIRYFFNFIVTIAGLSAFFMLVWGGFIWLTSAGDPGKIKTAKDIISSAVIGLLLLLGSYLLIQVINPDILILKTGGLSNCTALP